MQLCVANEKNCSLLRLSVEIECSKCVKMRHRSKFIAFTERIPTFLPTTEVASRQSRFDVTRATAETFILTFRAFRRDLPRDKRANGRAYTQLRNGAKRELF